MTKRKASTFVCQSCGYESPQWLGKCPGCQEWNSFLEESVTPKKAKDVTRDDNAPLKIKEVKEDAYARYVTGMNEFDRVLGGGLVAGSLVLIGGEPGIGKSTLILQVMGALARKHSDQKVLYVSGEESSSQVAGRSKRLQILEDNLYILNETNWQRIHKHIKKIRPKFLVLDSIQTSMSSEVQSVAGTVSQVREVTYEVMNLSKAENITSLVIGHITKEGTIAGPKILEHMVDTVIYFDGDQNGEYRILRAIKNRFGNTNEVGIFEMGSSGLLEVKNPSQYFLDDECPDASGRALTCVMEGSQSLFVEVQSLTVENKFGAGRRTTQGLDSNRLAMLVAILEKHCNLPIGYNDIYVNIVGGLKIKGRDADLAICASLISSYKGTPLPEGVVFIGEVGLTGEVRQVPQLEGRLGEMSRLGYKELVTAKRGSRTSDTVKVTGIKSVKDLFVFLGQ